MCPDFSKPRHITYVEDYQFLELYDLVKSMQEKINYLESKLDTAEDNIDNLNTQVSRHTTGL